MSLHCADAGSPPSVKLPWTAAAQKQQAQTNYYSDSSEEGSDEELKAMHNIRFRSRRRHEAVLFCQILMNIHAFSWPDLHF